MNPRITRAAMGLVAAGLLVVCFARAHETELIHWQRQAAKVSVGMLRSDVENILPPPDYSGVLWRLEDFRLLHARWLPMIRYAPKSGMVHSDLWNLQGYEVAPNVFVTIRYDQAGALPGPPYTGKSTIQPGDRVIDVPVVTDTAAGLKSIQ